MIKLEVNKKEGVRDSFIVRADEPVRISLDLMDSGHLLSYVYSGVEDDVEQDPSGFYDSEDIEHYSWEKNDEDVEVFSKIKAQEVLTEEEWITLQEILKKVK